jgi:hypothetical protein
MEVRERSTLEGRKGLAPVKESENDREVLILGFSSRRTF